MKSLRMIHVIAFNGRPVVLYEIDTLDKLGTRIDTRVGTWHEVIRWDHTEVATGGPIPVEDLSSLAVTVEHAN